MPPSVFEIAAPGPNSKFGYANDGNTGGSPYSSPFNLKDSFYAGAGGGATLFGDGNGANGGICILERA